MLTAELKQEVDTALEAALMLSPKDTPLMELAQRVYKSERELIAKVQESWILDRLVWMLSRKRQTIPAVDAEESQLLLPGFERLPRRLTINGHRTALRQATLSQLKEYRAILLRQISEFKASVAARDPLNDPRIVALDKLIELVSSYASKKRGRGITVADVIAAEKEKQNWQK